jgi:hypothetical protein
MDRATDLFEPCWEESGERDLPPLDCISDRQSLALRRDPPNQASDICWRVIHEVCVPILEAPESELRQRTRENRKKLADLLGAWRALVADQGAPAFAGPSAEEVGARIEAMYRSRLDERAGLEIAMALRSMEIAQAISHGLHESPPRDADRDYVLSLRYVASRETFHLARLCMVTALGAPSSPFSLAYVKGLAAGAAEACLAAAAEAEGLREVSDEDEGAPVSERTSYTLTDTGSATLRKLSS